MAKDLGNVVGRMWKEESIQHVFFQCSRARALWWCTLNIRADWQDFETFSFWLKRTLQVLANDNLFQIVKQMIFLLHRLWERRNSILHKGPASPVLSDMQYIHHSSNFHDLISGPHRKGKEQEAQHNFYLTQHPQGSLHSDTEADWIVIMKRCISLPGKRALVSSSSKVKCSSKSCSAKIL